MEDLIKVNNTEVLAKLAHIHADMQGVVRYISTKLTDKEKEEYKELWHYNYLKSMVLFMDKNENSEAYNVINSAYLQQRHIVLGRGLISTIEE